MRQNILKEIVVLVRMAFSFFVSLSLYSFFRVLSISFLGFFSYFKIPPGGTMGGNDDALNANKKKREEREANVFCGVFESFNCCVLDCHPLSPSFSFYRPNFIETGYLCLQSFFMYTIFFPSYQLPKSDSVHQQTFSDL